MSGPLGLFGFPGASRAKEAEHGRGRVVFTVDVEEYFQALVFEHAIPVATWPAQISRLQGQMEILLDLLAHRHATATFFVVGWVAERFPDLVREIHRAGHEIGSHGQLHRRVHAIGAAGFREELRLSRDILQDIIGRPILGYRAPSFSITPGSEWAFDILLEEGFRYDSSLFPIARPGYGHVGSPPDAFWIPRLGGDLLELPMTTFPLCGLRVPAGGGAYFRHMPYAFTRRALRAGSSRIFYIHPWELDPDQPRVPVSRLRTHRHYGGLRQAVTKLRRLLADFDAVSVEEAYGLRESEAVARGSA